MPRKEVSTQISSPGLLAASPLLEDPWSGLLGTCWVWGLQNQWTQDTEGGAGSSGQPSRVRPRDPEHRVPPLGQKIAQPCKVSQVSRLKARIWASSSPPHPHSNTSSSSPEERGVLCSVVHLPPLTQTPTPSPLS